MGVILKFRRSKRRRGNRPRRDRHQPGRLSAGSFLLLPVFLGFAIPLGLLYLDADSRSTMSPPSSYSDGTSETETQPSATRLLRVLDGDTVELSTGTGFIGRVRLSTVDAPEGNQPYGIQSKRCLANILRSGKLSVKVQGTDRYGRTLASLYVDDNRVDVQLVEQGCAWWYSRYAPASLALARAQIAAKSQQRGLWAGQNPIEPERWRQGER